MSGAAPPAERRSSRLLVIDDEASLREMLTVLFEGEGLVVDSAGSVEEARKRFASWAHNTQVSFVGAFPRKGDEKP